MCASGWPGPQTAGWASPSPLHLTGAVTSGGPRPLNPWSPEQPAGWSSQLSLGRGPSALYPALFTPPWPFCSFLSSDARQTSEPGRELTEKETEAHPPSRPPAAAAGSPGRSPAPCGSRARASFSHYYVLWRFRLPFGNGCISSLLSKVCYACHKKDLTSRSAGRRRQGSPRTVLTGGAGFGSRTLLSRSILPFPCDGVEESAWQRDDRLGAWTGFFLKILLFL